MGKRFGRKHRPLQIGAVAITGSPVTTGTQNVAYTGFTLLASGGVTPYIYSVDSGGSALPTGMTLNSSSGAVAGTPSVAGTFANITLKVTDSASTPVVALLTPFTLVITAAPVSSDFVSNVTLSRGALTLASAGAYRILANDGRQITATSITGGTATSWSVTQPNILTRSVAGVTDASTIIVQCTDANSNTDSATITLSSVASYYSVIADPSGAETEFKAALSAIGAAGGKSVLMEPGTHKLTYNAEGWNSRAFASQVVIEGRDHSNLPIVQGPALIKSPQNIKFYYLEFFGPQTTQTTTPCFSMTGTGINGTIFSHCTFRGIDWRASQSTSLLPAYSQFGYLGFMSRDGSARVSGTGTIGLKFDHCDFYGARRMLVLPPSNNGGGDPGYSVVEDCTFHEISADYLVFEGSHKIVRRNTMYNPYANPADVSHADFCQHANSAFVATDVYIHDNIFYSLRNDALVSKDSIQGPFQQTGAGANGGYTFTRVAVWNNFYVGPTVQGTMISNPVDVEIFNNTLLSSTARNFANSRPRIYNELSTGDAFTNGTFSSTTGWTQGTGWLISGGVATKTAGTASDLTRSIVISGSYTYTVAFTITGMTSGTLTPSISGNGTTVTGTARSSSGTYSQDLVSISANTKFNLTASSTFNGVVDDVTLTRTPAGTGAAVNQTVKNNVASAITETNNNHSWQGANSGDTLFYSTFFTGPTFAPSSYTEALTMFTPKEGGPLTVAGGATVLAGAINADGTLGGTTPTGLTLTDPV